MGNPRFKISNMMPNAWFNKHIGTNKPKTLHREPQEKINAQKAPQAFTQNRASYYVPSASPLHPKALDTHFPSDPPREPTRKPPRKIPTTPKLISSHSEYAKDFILELPPIATKPPNREESKKKQQRQQEQEAKLINYNCKKLRMRVHSPKVKVFNQRLIKHRKGTPPPTLSESFVVIKISRDPRKDFRESMLEMIRENELRGSKDLEELLACYLCLNSTDYHDVIVKVFEEIWFDINVIRRL